MSVIGVDLGNKRSFFSIVRGNDEKTKLGGECHDLLPARQAAGGGIPSTYFYSARRGELIAMDAESSRARPLANRLSLLKRHLNETTRLEDKEISINEVLKKVFEYGFRAALHELDAQYHESTNQVSLAYPVTYNAAQRKLLKELVESIDIDGQRLKVVGTIVEPAAAGLDYLAENGGTSSEKTVLVYDLGGGTFDVAIVTVYPMGRKRANGDIYYYDILQKNGIASLGGAEFDSRMQEIIIRKIGEKPTGHLLDILPNIVENAKIELSTSEETEPLILDPNGGYYDINVTRAEFEKATEDLVIQTVDQVRDMLGSNPNVDVILLTGGASQMPMIRQALVRAFPAYKDRIVAHRPSRAISYGAARYGVNEDYVQQRTIWDVGIGYVDSTRPDYRSYVDILIPAGTPIPCKKLNRAVTVRPTRFAATNVYEAKVVNPERYEVGRDFHKITSAILEFDKEVPKGTEIHDVLSIDEHNILRVISYDPTRQEETLVEATIEYNALK